MQRAEPEFLGSMQMDCCCCICLQPPPAHEARVINPCGHIFCERCLSQACAARMECPVDRTPLAAGAISEAPADVIALASQCPVRCSNWKSGCPWAKDWENWWAESHATTCTFLPPQPCPVPGCDSLEPSDGHHSADAASASAHDKGRLYDHVRLLAQALAQSAAANRALQHEVDTLKAALYAVQNDLSHVMHRQREQRDLDASHQIRAVLAEDISREQGMLGLPRFAVKDICSAPPSRAAFQQMEWDSRLSNKTLAVNGSSFCHTGSQRGWGTVLARHSVRAALNHPTRVRFTVAAAAADDDVAQQQQQSSVGSPCAGSGSPIAQSMIMVGFATNKSVIREAVANSVSVHLGSLPGCWAYQGSGFVWVGDVKLCTQLEGHQLEPAALEFGIGDVIECTLEVTMTAGASAGYELRILCRKPPMVNNVLGASLSIGLQSEFELFPGASLGMHGATVSVETLL